MSRYHHRKDGTPVLAIQFTNRYSAENMRREFQCDVRYVAHSSHILVDGVKVERGEYAVQAFPAIVAIDQDKFDERYQKDERQMEMF